MAVRELAGRPPARARRQRPEPEGQLSRLLQPRPAVQRHRRARRGDPLDLPAAADGQPPGLRRAGLLELRAGGVPLCRGDELRDAAGDGSGGDAARDVVRASRRIRCSRSSSRARWTRFPRTGAEPAPEAATASPARGGSTRRLRSTFSPPELRRATCYEPNDGAALARTRCTASRREVEATIDYWNDRDDVYRVYLQAGEQLTATGRRTSARPARRSRSGDRERSRSTRPRCGTGGCCRVPPARRSRSGPTRRAGTCWTRG